MTDVLDELVGMSRELGSPQHDYAMLGEGNTSSRVDAESFWVKASGTQLAQADRASFVRVQTRPILEALERDTLDDAAIKDLLKTSTIEGGRAPSIETFLHALCLQIEGVNFVGHTHPTAAVGLLCSNNGRDLFAGSLFPDQIVVLGPAYAFVPYSDPGLALSMAVKHALDHFLKLHQREPKVLLMENHGIIALGHTAQEVLNITAMLVKTCRIITGTLAAGGPRFLSQAQVDRIDKRPDELARRKGFK
ncbi:MAG: class II aldolase [Phycisphaerales bacterium]|nr:class II aldolase [Phycisphaerales bacterium]